ncbi:glycosyltransferase [Roseibacillus persicicus]|uniref:glycosyltransferase n=1 Tax=Roseibacillus persicicus TaxID=454148 RepID=UPI00398AC3C7
MTNLQAQITVVMAVRNAAATLRDAVDSILQQTLAPAELILVLNGCTDESQSIADDLAKGNKRIRLEKTDSTGGVAAAARLGCALAKSPLLARMDADDLSHPERLEWQYASLRENEADLVTCRVEALDSQGAGLDRFIDWANSLAEPEDFRRERFVESPVIQPGVLMSREAYQRAGGYRVEDGPEDYDLWLRMLADGACFVQAPRARLQWRDSATRLTRSHDDYSEQRMTTTKARYLARLEKVRSNGVAIAGSGPIGRRLAGLLLAEGVQVHGFYDVAPKKIGKTALGLPIWAAGDLLANINSPVLLGCVGRGGRARVRSLAAKAGYREGDDFFACC